MVWLLLLFSCDQDGCDYKAKQAGDLKRHKQRKHPNPHLPYHLLIEHTTTFKKITTPMIIHNCYYKKLTSLSSSINK